MWDGVVGQEQAVARLRRAVERPSHAYLLAGPRGSGVLEAARCFAAALVCPDGGCGACNSCRRARSARHPDVIEVEPAGTFVVVDQVEEMMKEAYTSPFEAERKVIVVTEADRMNEPAANKLLKTLEEPPARTHFVLLSESPDELLPTVRSRCQRIDFAALSDAVVAAALVAAGVEPEAAAAAARVASGRLDRARSLAALPGAGASPPGLAALRRAALEVAASLDGSGAAAALGAEGIQAVLADTLTGLERDQKQEAKALEAELTEAGYPDRLARRLRRDVEQRQVRALRRARTDALAEIVTALECFYRDALVAGSGAAVGALDACAEARRIIAARTAINETLLLEHLLVHLPPAANLEAPARVAQW
ncbi:MAG TPA: DNA polymerase III subunit delta' [Acidimicrobiia bacterium]|nr:DNA polymerase III subunit delta' [Acidimicrobiia bacterium]